MGMATSKVRLNICGSSYVVNTSESEDYMQNLADRLNLDMNELMASSNSVSGVVSRASFVCVICSGTISSALMTFPALKMESPRCASARMS